MLTASCCDRGRKPDESPARIRGERPSVVGRQKQTSAAPVGLGDDPDARPVLQMVRRENAIVVLQCTLVLQLVKLLQITPIAAQMPAQIGAWLFFRFFKRL